MPPRKRPPSSALVLCDWHGCPVLRGGPKARRSGSRPVYADFRCPLGSSGHSVDVYQKYAIYTWHYHRIIDCFLPLLPLLHRVHNDISRGHGRNLVVLVQNHSVGDFLGEWTRLPRVELSNELPRSRLPLVPRSWTVDKATAPTNLTPSNLRGRPAEAPPALSRAAPGTVRRPPFTVSIGAARAAWMLPEATERIRAAAAVHYALARRPATATGGRSGAADNPPRAPR